MNKRVCIVVAMLLATINVRLNAESLSLPYSETIIIQEDFQGGQYEIIGTSTVNIRTSASTSSKIVGKLKKGDIITVQSVSSGWAKFMYNGKVAFVSAKYLKKIEEQRQVEVVEVPKENYVPEVLSQDDVPYVNNLTDQGNTESAKEDDDSYGSLNFSLMTSFHGELPVYGFTAELSGYNALHYETGLRSNFTKSYLFSWHNAFGYSIGLYKWKNSQVALVVPVAVDLSDRYTINKYGNEEDKLFLDFSFAPRVKLKLGKSAVLSAGYCMNAYKFKFDKEYLYHCAVFSLGYAF